MTRQCENPLITIARHPCRRRDKGVVCPRHFAHRQLVCQLQRLAGDVLLVLRWAGLQAPTALPREEEHLFQDNRKFWRNLLYSLICFKREDASVSSEHAHQRCYAEL